MTPILYCHPASGFSYKVSLALSLLGIETERRFVDLWQPRDQRSPEFQSAALHGEVPVLQIDGHTLCQSNAILDYLARREGRLDGRSETDRLRVREWLSWEANRVGLNVAHARYGRSWGAYDPAVLRWYDQRSQQDFDRLQQQLATSSFLVGDRITIADAACVGYLYFIGEADTDWAQQAGLDLDRWPAVRDWLARITQQPGFHTPEAMFSNS